MSHVPERAVHAYLIDIDAEATDSEIENQYVGLFETPAEFARDHYMRHFGSITKLPAYIWTNINWVAVANDMRHVYDYVHLDRATVAVFTKR